MVLDKVYKDPRAKVDGTVYWKNDKEDVNNNMNVQVLKFLVDRRGAMAEQNLQEATRLLGHTPMMRRSLGVIQANEQECNITSS